VCAAAPVVDGSGDIHQHNSYALAGLGVGYGMEIETPRTRLRYWDQTDRDAFAAMHADPQVMHDCGGPISRRESDAKLDRYAATYRQYGFCRWAIEGQEGGLLGYAGIMPSRPGHPLGPHSEIGWRLVRRAWGHGYATEAARAALDDAFTRVRLTEVIAYTALDNWRSQAVMGRLQLWRDPSRDFTADYDAIRGWRGLVWVARRTGDPL
jgi:RimJ/RimL family protein N-acetyltransferase